MGRRGDHTKEELQQMIVGAAEDIVATDGMNGLTMRKIAGAIGYTVGSLYLIYRNQDELIIDLNGRTVDELRQHLEQAATSTPDAKAALHAIADAYLGFAAENIHRWRMAFEHRLPDGQKHPHWLDNKVEATFSIFANALSNIIPNAPDESLRMHVFAFWSSIHGLCMLDLTGRLEWERTVKTDDLTDFLVNNFINGIGNV